MKFYFSKFYFFTVGATLFTFTSLGDSGPAIQKPQFFSAFAKDLKANSEISVFLRTWIGIVTNVSSLRSKSPKQLYQIEGIMLWIFSLIADILEPYTGLISPTAVFWLLVFGAISAYFGLIQTSCFVATRKRRMKYNTG